MEWICTVCLIGLIICLIKLKKKQVIDKSEYNKYWQELVTVKSELSNINYQYQLQSEKTKEAEEKYWSIIEQYKKATSKNQEDLDNFFIQQRDFRQSQLDTEFEEKARKNEELLQSNYLKQKHEYEDKVASIQEESKELIEKAKASAAAIIAETQLQQEKYEGLLAPLQQYEKEKQAKLFYTIQTPDEYKQDIEFLLTTVAQKVQHPDIINKLVWAEYVKPYLDETFKRVGIENKPGIYKLTNLDSGKCYIGKSTDIKKRIADHFKSSIGIKTIADQQVHHAILETGFWNWLIEYIIYCDKDELNDLEKYYINFFKSQEFGYNKNAGGSG